MYHKLWTITPGFFKLAAGYERAYGRKMFIGSVRPDHRLMYGTTACDITLSERHVKYQTTKRTVKYS